MRCGRKWNFSSTTAVAYNSLQLVRCQIPLYKYTRAIIIKIGNRKFMKRNSLLYFYIFIIFLWLVAAVAAALNKVSISLKIISWYIDGLVDNSIYFWIIFEISLPSCSSYSCCCCCVKQRIFKLAVSGTKLIQ